ncbi:hypothetical protein B0H11DRAFT_2200469 [Mycena galericulata]|nr:hypothetical protein B0H11DRAFT_2200469 [Mycena galericulata]
MAPKKKAAGKPKANGKGPRSQASARDGHAPDSSPLPALPSDDDFLPLAPVKPKRKPAPLPPPRSPLPDRINRVKQPGKPDMPKEIRTHDQVEADDAEIAALKAEIAKMKREQIETLARMELDEDEDAAMIADSTILHQAQTRGMPIVGATFGRREPQQQLDPLDSDTPFLEFDDEDFDAVAEADERIRRAVKAENAVRAKEADRYNLDKLPPLPKAQAEKKVSKARKRGDGRAVVEDAKQKMMSHKRALSGDELDLEEEVPQKKLKPAFPRGVVANWRGKISAVGTTSGQGTSKKSSGFPLGGLADDDLEAQRPSRRTHGVKNTIEIISDSDSDETPIKPRPQPVPKRKDALAPSTARVNLKTEYKPQKSVARVKVKAESSTTVDSETVGLPEFARAAWIPVYLPTLYHFAGTRDGWEFCALGKEVDVIQMIVNLVFVKTTYKVKKGCPIYTTSISRLADKRHLIGSMTIKIIDTFFTSSEYADKPTKTARYARWAIEETGPAWYEVPTPRGLLRGVPGYAPPTGLFRSKFCLVPLTAYVKSTAKSKGEFGNRYIGAIAMICAGIERAFNQYTTTGVKTLNGSFSRERVGDYVTGFSQTAQRVEDSRWNKLMQCCIAQMQIDNGHLISASASMNVNRAALALGSSPAKGSDDDDDDDM